MNIDLPFPYSLQKFAILALVEVKCMSRLCCWEYTEGNSRNKIYKFNSGNFYYFNKENDFCPGYYK